jgi:transcriptional regulator with XRE-family HTH domain
MILLGKTARHLRETNGLTQREAAELLDVTVVHLSNIENDKSAPSPSLMERYRKLWGVDLYVLAWCLHGDPKKLPPAVRKPAAELADAWRTQLGRVAKRKQEAGSSHAQIQDDS